MLLDMESRVVAAEGALSTDLGDDVVLLDPLSGKYIILAATAADIWRGIQAPVRIGTLCGRLAEEYAAPADRVTASTLAFLDDLLARRLIASVA